MTSVNKRETLPVELALLASLLLHLLAFAMWANRDTLARLMILKPIFHLVAPTPKPVAAKHAAPVITFVEEPVAKPKPKNEKHFTETDPSQVTGEAPTDSKLYSDRATVAANPNNPTGKTGETPYLEGKESRMLSTESVVPTPGAPPAPAPRPSTPPAPKPASPPAPLSKPPTPKPEEPTPKLADTGLKIVEERKVALLEKPVVMPTVPVPPPAPVSPPTEPVPPSPPSSVGSHRDIAAVKSRMSASGSSRIGIAAFNVADSPFGPYDKALIRAVQSRWYALIEKNGLYERAGQVTLHFNLVQDGSVKDLKINANSAGEILGLFCEKAVVDSAPFPPLPENLRALIGNDPREINFTFYY